MRLCPLMLSVRTDHSDVEVRLPPALRRFGERTRVRITGNPDGPVVAALGGISGSRMVCRGENGGPGWWAGLVGEDCAIDPGRFRILGLDFAADPSGRSAPSSQDQASVLEAALNAAAIPRLRAIVGASYGGMVGLSFAEQFPDRVEKLVIISAGCEPHPAASATRELQRRIVALGIARGVGEEALSIARGMAMLSYRTSAEFAERFRGGIDGDDPLETSQPGAYLRARGDAFNAVMTPERFLSLSASIDRHRIDPSRIDTPALLIGATTDQLVPPCQTTDLAASLVGETEIHLLDFPCGHDMFLKEAAAIGRLVKPFLDN